MRLRRLRMTAAGQLYTGIWAAAVLGCCWGCCLVAGAQRVVEFQMEFTNAGLTPSHWVLKLSPDGSGHFDADGGQAALGGDSTIQTGEIHQAIQLSSGFTARVLETARQRRMFAYNCESKMKVAYQGTKRLSYSGPEGSGSCEYNYSKDREIQALGDSLLAVENTLLYGARLDKLLQHDRLGVDREMENLAEAVHDGTALEVCAIRATLERIAGDEDVIERARRRARLLLTQSRL